MAFVCAKRHTDKLACSGKNDKAGEEVETMSWDGQLEELGKEKPERNDIIISNYIRALG